MKYFIPQRWLNYYDNNRDEVQMAAFLVALFIAGFVLGAWIF